MHTTYQPAPQVLVAARLRLGCTQKALADRLRTYGVPCSAHTVERWETPSRRHRDVPEQIWPQVRTVLGVEDVVVPETASNRPVQADPGAAAPVGVPTVRVRPLLRRARPETCLQVCRCPRYECVRCGTVVTGDALAGEHICPAIAFLLAPSAELLAELAARDLAEGVA